MINNRADRELRPYGSVRLLSSWQVQRSTLVKLNESTHGNHRSDDCIRCPSLRKQILAHFSQLWTTERTPLVRFASRLN